MTLLDISASILGITITIGILIAYVFARTFLVIPQRDFTLFPGRERDELIEVKEDGPIVKRFLKALRFATITRSPTDINEKELKEFGHFIEEEFPLIHQSPLVTREIIADLSLLYKVQGSDVTLKPYMLIGHLDVVPATDEKWQVPPFSGKIRNGFIYGRGTIDVKQVVMGVMEALEFLFSRGYEPQKSFYIAFGHDEEVGGFHGAKVMSEHLEDLGVELDYLLDEGDTVSEGMYDGVDVPTAVICVAEKGYLNVKLTVETSGGHSAMPIHDHSALCILASAINKLENNPHPSQFCHGPERATFEQLAPSMRWPQRILMSNLWLFGPLVSRTFYRWPTIAALINTTTAITVFHSGIKDNVIPASAWAIVNHRIHTGETSEQVLKRDKAIINDDRVKMEITFKSEPLPVSPYGEDATGYQVTNQTINQLWGHKNVAVAPGVMIGISDSRHYKNLTKNIYRFAPSYLYPEDMLRFHGYNERISVENYEEVVNFYLNFIKNADIMK